jgi:hypothetical protein
MEYRTMFRTAVLPAVLSIMIGSIPAALLADEVTAEELVKQLSSRQFADRQQASEKLAEMGIKAIDALSDAALHGNREAMTRSIEVLKGHFQGTNVEMKSAAKTALEKIAASGKAQASHRADEVLHPKPPAAVLQPQIRLGQIQIQLQAVGQGARRISVKTVNGVKEINATENGVKVKIIDDPKKGITVEVTTEKNGKKEVKKYEAKSAEELKKNHPEAYKFYAKYNKQNVIQFRIQGRPNIQIVPLQGRFNVQPVSNRRKMSKTVGELKKQLEETARKLAEIESDTTTTNQIQEALKQLKNAQAKLKELAESLR